MKRIIAGLILAVSLGVNRPAHAQARPEIETWNAAVARAEVEAWNIAIWNQAVVDAEVGQLSWDCNLMMVAMVANGAERSDLHHWLYIGRRESNCLLGALADRPRTGDYSVCWFQINYYRGLYWQRVMAYGPPELLRTDPDACARAAIAMQRGSGWAPWR